MSQHCKGDLKIMKGNFTPESFEINTGLNLIAYDFYEIY